MKKLTVKKDNALVNASHNFTTSEQRLILMAVAQGQDCISEMHRISAIEFAKAYGLTNNAAYKGLKEAVLHLFERRFSWTEKTERGNTRHVQARWVSKVAYIDAEGLVELRFSEDVLPLLAELKERFTMYDLENIKDLTSSYAIRLYELLIAWRLTGKTPNFPLQDFREKLGLLPSEYPRMTDFKRRVLDVAIKQINKHTDITASYEQHKRGRSISGFSFTFEMKKSTQVIGLPAKSKRKQITKREAEQMARPGESWSQLLDRIKGEYWITDLESKPDTSDEG